MIKRASVLVLLAISAQAARLEKIGDLLMVTPGGQIVPGESAASIADLAELSAHAVANAQAAALASQGVAQVSARQAEIEAFVYAQEGTLYLNSFNVLSVGPPLAADTNLLATVVLLEPKIRVYTDPSYVVNRVTMSFSADPGYMPVFRQSTNLRSTNVWDIAETIDQGYTNRLIGATYYEDAVWTEVLTPASWTNAYFRGFTEVRGSGTNVVNYTINNGIAIRGETPLTATFIQGTNTLKIIGGVVCTP